MSGLVGLVLGGALVLAVSFRGHPSSQAATTAKRLVKPKVGFSNFNTYGEAVTAKPQCSEKTHDTFHIHGSGFTPYGQATYLIFYPLNSSEHGAQYTFIKDPNVQADQNGRFNTDLPWKCWYGPNGTMDPRGWYRIFAIDRTTWKITPVKSFRVVTH